MPKPKVDAGVAILSFASLDSLCSDRVSGARGGAPMTVSVPFNFKVGATDMEAGEQRVTFPTQSSVMILGADRRRAAMALTNREESGRPTHDAKLVFQRYGDQ